MSPLPLCPRLSEQTFRFPAAAARPGAFPPPPLAARRGSFRGALSPGVPSTKIAQHRGAGPKSPPLPRGLPGSSARYRVVGVLWGGGGVFREADSAVRSCLRLLYRWFVPWRHHGRFKGSRIKHRGSHGGCVPLSRSPGKAPSRTALPSSQQGPLLVLGVETRPRTPWPLFGAQAITAALGNQLSLSEPFIPDPKCL